MALFIMATVKNDTRAVVKEVFIEVSYQCPVRKLKGSVKLYSEILYIDSLCDF